MTTSLLHPTGIAELYRPAIHTLDRIRLHLAALGWVLIHENQTVTAWSCLGEDRMLTLPADENQPGAAELIALALAEVAEVHRTTIREVLDQVRTVNAVDLFQAKVRDDVLAAYTVPPAVAGTIRATSKESI